MTPSEPPARPLRPGSTRMATPRARTVKDRSGTVPPDSSDTVRENLSGGEAKVSFTKKEQQQIQDLTGMYDLVGVLSAAVSKDVGEQIVSNSSEAAIAWVTLAQRNSRVKNMIDSMTSASVWATVLAVHMRMLAPAISIPVISGKAKANGPTTNDQDLAVMEEWLRATQGGAVDNAALDLAMQMMKGQQETGEGGPTDTVTVRQNGNGAPIGSAEYKAPPMDPSEYPFPMDAAPPRGRPDE